MSASARKSRSILIPFSSTVPCLTKIILLSPLFYVFLLSPNFISGNTKRRMYLCTNMPSLSRLTTCPKAVRCPRKRQGISQGWQDSGGDRARYSVYVCSRGALADLRLRWVRVGVGGYVFPEARQLKTVDELEGYGYVK